MSDKPYKVKTKTSGTFDAEDYATSDEGLFRFVIGTHVDKGEITENAKYIPLHDIICIDAIEFADMEEDEEEEPEMSKE